MKQKRKVKSLLPQKNDWRSSFLTAVLLILSVALCIGSASLITSRVRAVEPGEIGVFDYNGLDEKQEVIYGMRFVDPASMITRVNNMYIKGKSFYITPNSVIVNPMTVGGDIIDTSVNKVNPGVYGHVLGGKDNVVNSDNVTLIAGENNVVTEGNANAAFLGGQSNNNFGRMGEGGTPMVVVGGSNNSIGDNHDGVALIGGNGNKIWDNVSDSFILGGEENEIGTGRTNVIVGGKKVKVRNVDNVFVYSNKGDGTNLNDEFEPQSSDSFYLNVGNGVGINTNPSNRGLAVGGVVNLGDIDIVTLECNEDNLGVEGKVSNCVVGCTKASLPGGQWEMLDRGVECQAVCGGIPGNRCIFTGEVIEPAPSYDSYCTPADFTGHSHMCYEDELEEYGNSVFETSLIDSDKECPASDENENKCVYQCDEGYHLTGDVAGGHGSTFRCYKNCEYEWADGTIQILKHNETVSAYNVQTVSCSNDIYVFPFATEIIKKGLPALTPAGLSVGNKTVNGVTYRNRATNGYSPETCVNYEHKKTLVCNNGTMYLTMDNDGKRANNSLNAKAKGYKYNSCDTVNYRCNTGAGEYQFTKTDITKPFTDNGLQDSGDGWNNKKDREQFSLTRGQYKLCLDYNGVSPESCEQVDKLDATKLAHDEHYKFIKCNTPYYTEYPAGSRHCMKSCSATLNGRTYTNIPHGQTKDFYKSNEETCLDRCEWATFTCDDGKWIQSGTNQVRDETSPYQYYGCTQKDKLCDRAVYNVSQKEHDDHISTSLYEESCDEYDGKQRNICDFTLTVYRLTGCKPGYHTENGKWCVDNVKDMACPSKPSNSHWVRTSGPIQNYPWSNIITKYKTTLNAGWYLVWWNESCAWNDPISCWTDELQPGNGGKVSPGNACEWACDTGYIRNGNTCRYIETTCKYPDGDQSACTNDEPYGCEDVDATTQKEGQGAGEGEWRWECTNDKTSEACLICKDGYHLEKDASGNRKCKPNVNGMCDPNPSGNYGCLAGLIDERSDLDESKYTWWCRGIDGYDRSHDEGPYCSSATDVDNCYKCKPGYHKTSNYGECLINECSSTNRPSGDGVIYGEGTPDTHNKSWSYVSSSYLGACQWTCDESEGYERYGNGCRLKTYTITYNGNGGTPDRASDTVTHGDSVYLPGAERVCHDFDGWNGTMGEGYYYGPVKSNVTLTAQWTTNPYTIRYNCKNGGTELIQTETYGTQATLKTAGCSKQDYKLIGWSSDSAATTVTWELGAVIGEDLINSCNGKTVYAVYKKIENGECDLSEPYGCMDDSNEKNKVDTTTDTEWKWYCVGDDETSPLCTKSCPSGTTLVWTDLHEGDCVSEMGDNECDFKEGKCKYDELNGSYLYQELGTFNGGKTWLCKTPGKEPLRCEMQWVCEGDCQGLGNGNCGVGMYQAGVELDTEDKCKAAGAYGKDLTPIGPCTFNVGVNFGGTYSSVPDCNQLRFDPLSQQDCGQYPYCWSVPCFKFTNATEVCYTQVGSNTKNKYTGTNAASNCKTSLKPSTQGWCTNSNSYKISFKLNGCSSTNQSDRYLDAGASLSFLSTAATCSPNSFKGWNDKADCSGKTWKSSDTMPSNNLTLYACSEAEADPCADYPLTSKCTGAGEICSKCPYGERWKFEGCAPTWEVAFPNYLNEPRFQGGCPVGGRCAPSGVTIYQVNNSKDGCEATGPWFKLVGCDSCSSEYTYGECPSDAVCDKCEGKYELAPGGHSCLVRDKYVVRLACKMNGNIGCDARDGTNVSPSHVQGQWFECDYQGYHIQCNSANQGRSYCHAAPYSTYPEGCSITYYRGRPFTQWHDYNGNAITDGGLIDSNSSEKISYDPSSPTATNGWVSYCGTKQSKAECDKVGVVGYDRQGSGFPYFRYLAVNNRSAYNNTYGHVGNAARCCEWVQISGGIGS